MSMRFKGPINKLKVCPACGSPKLVAAVYGLNRDPLGSGNPVIECEGCYSVVIELTKSERLSLQKTPEGRAILERESEVS
jgi:hypothetical protein